MSTLHESVIIRTGAGPNLHGELFVGEDGLPTLRIPRYPDNSSFKSAFYDFYIPATFPATWTVCYHPGNETDILIYVWTRICDMRREIVDAQREVEQHEPDDDITAYKRARDEEETHGEV